MAQPVTALDAVFDYATLESEYKILSSKLAPQSHEYYYMGQKKVHNYTTLTVYNQLDDVDHIDSIPYTRQVCNIIQNVLGLQFNFACFRLMRPRSTFGWHRDLDCSREVYHIPIKTNQGCFYVYDDRVYNMQELGRLYRVYNDSWHTFINAGEEPRLHLHFLYDQEGNYLKNLTS